MVNHCASVQVGYVELNEQLNIFIPQNKRTPKSSYYAILIKLVIHEELFTKNAICGNEKKEFTVPMPSSEIDI